MRLIRPLLAIACLGLGIVVGVLNRDAVAIDLAAVAVRTTLGVALLGALLTGVLIGGLAMALGRSVRFRGHDVTRSFEDAGREI